MNSRTSLSLAALSAVILLGAAVSCGTARKAASIRERGLAPQLVLPGESDLPEMTLRRVSRDTLTVPHHEGRPG